MTVRRLEPATAVAARIAVPGDKSIAHRALLLNALTEGTAWISGLPNGRDVASMASALQVLGVRIETGAPGSLQIVGGTDWRSSTSVDCGNAGTVARLLMGALAPRASGPVTLTGDASLVRRPMDRVADPLRAMGARIEDVGTAGRLPMTITGTRLAGFRYRAPVASAQVKSALLLAGLEAAGETVVEEMPASRDHTERMLAAMGARIVVEAGRVELYPGPLSAIDIDVPGDISSAAPFLALAALRPGWSVEVRNVGLNATRTGWLDLLAAFGARVEIEIVTEHPEPVGTVYVEGRSLSAVEVGGAFVPRAIDELPLVAVLATQAEGETRVVDAAELKVKESDRIQSMVEGLRAMGAEIDGTADGFVVHGPTRLQGAQVDTAADHRVGMALAVAAMAAAGATSISGAEWVDVSYPGFFEELARAVQPGGQR